MFREQKNKFSFSKNIVTFVKCKLLYYVDVNPILPRDELNDGRCISTFFLKRSKSWNNLDSFLLNIGKNKWNCDKKLALKIYRAPKLYTETNVSSASVKNV